MKVLAFDDLATWYNANKDRIRSYVLTPNEWNCDSSCVEQIELAKITSETKDQKDAPKSSREIQETSRGSKEKEPKPRPAKKHKKNQVASSDDEHQQRKHRTKKHEKDDLFSWWASHGTSHQYQLATNMMPFASDAPLLHVRANDDSHAISQIVEMFYKTKHNTKKPLAYLPDLFPLRRKQYDDMAEQRQFVGKIFNNLWFGCYLDAQKELYIQMSFIDLAKNNNLPVLRENLIVMFERLFVHVSNENTNIQRIFARAVRVALESYPTI